MQRYRHSRVNVGITNLQCPWYLLSLPCKDTIIEGSKSNKNIQQISRVDIGVTNLQCPWNLQRLPYKDTTIQRWTLALQTYSVLEICKVYHTKIQKLQGGCWRYKRAVSKNICKVYHTKTKIKGWTLALQTCNALQDCSLPYEDTNVQGWMFALQTYSVRETCKACHTKIQKLKGGR